MGSKQSTTIHSTFDPSPISSYIWERRHDVKSDTECSFSRSFFETPKDAAVLFHSLYKRKSTENEKAMFALSVSIRAAFGNLRYCLFVNICNMTNTRDILTSIIKKDDSPPGHRVATCEDTTETHLLQIANVLNRCNSWEIADAKLCATHLHLPPYELRFSRYH